MQFRNNIPVVQSSDNLYFFNSTYANPKKNGSTISNQFSSTKAYWATKKDAVYSDIIKKETLIAIGCILWFLIK